MGAEQASVYSLKSTLLAAVWTRTTQPCVLESPGLLDAPALRTCSRRFPSRPVDEKPCLSPHRLGKNWIIFFSVNLDFSPKKGNNESEKSPELQLRHHHRVS